MMNKKTAAERRTKQVYCDKEVKDIFRNYNHRKCTSTKRRMYCVPVSGKILNDYLVSSRESSTDPRRFNVRKKYHVCCNLHGMLKRVPKAAASDDEEKENTPLLSVVPTTVQTDLTRLRKNHNAATQPNKEHDIKSRSQRLFLRNRIPADDPRLKGVKKVLVRVEDDEVGEIDTTKMRVSTKAVFANEVLNHYYRIPFAKMKMRGRRERMAEIAKVVISACIDRKEFRKDPDEYIVNNVDVGIQVLNLLDGVKDYIQSKMQLNFNAISNIALPPVEEDNEGMIGTLDEKKDNHHLAKILLGETTRDSYERIRKTLKPIATIPTYYKLIKSRPSVLPMTVQPLDPLDSSDGTPDFLDMEAMNRIPDEYELELVMRQLAEAKEKELNGARLDGGYNKYMELLKNHHEVNDRNVDVDVGDGDRSVIVLDSIDGAEHKKSKSTITSVISFSSSMLCGEWINAHRVTGGASSHILTWQQLRAKESIHTMMPAVKSYFEEKKILRQSEEYSRYFFYDLHDGKMLYLLCQHSQWNRKKNPFLLCKCNRGEGVRNNANHVCTWLTHDEQIESYERSKRRWNRKRSQPIPRKGKEYKVKDHMNWADDSNLGVSHFGIHPDLLPRDGIRFDTFHMKCAITRKLMGYIRRFMLNQATDVLESFITDVLGKFWNDFHLYVWKNKKNFSSFQGNELALFIVHTNDIVAYLKDSFDETEELQHMIEGFTLWVDIFKFLGTTYIEDSEKYKVNMKGFEENLKKFYSCGAKTFLSSAGGITDGDEETFYSHALRFYMPPITRQTFERHHVGVGIFNMQGFERRNKESKNMMTNHCNNRGNILVTNLNRLWDAFETNGTSSSSNNK